MLPGEYQNQPSGQPEGPFRFFFREQSGPNPARKPDLRPRRIIAEHRGLEQREGQHEVQSWPRAHVLGCGSQRLSMNGFTHLGRRGGPFAPSLKLGRGVFCNRSGSGLFRRDGLPPFPRVCNFTQLVAEEFNTGARIFVGGVEAAQAALAPGAETNITFVVDCRHDQGLGRHGFCVTASCQPPRDAALPLQIRQSPALLIWPIPRGAWLLHPHGLG